MTYIPTEWNAGNIITAERLNKIEQGIVAADYGNNVRRFLTAADMRYDSSLAVGNMCQTAGYSEVGDRGDTMYIIGTEPYLWGSISLANGLYANLVDHERVNAIALGFKSDGTDNGPVLEALMVTKRLHANLYLPLTIVFPAGDFVFSPVQCDTCGLNFEGYGIPNNRTGTYTRFLPAGDQEYIIKLGRANVLRYGPNGSQFMYRGCSIKRIKFSTLKYGQDDGLDELKADNWWTLSKAALVIGRLTESKFEDLDFRRIFGSAISITASYELSFYNTYMYHLVCLDNGALNFAYDVGNDQQGWASDNSAIYFDYIAMEAIAGDCVTFDRLCDTYNVMFGTFDYEDYRTSSNWGTEWTSDTWLPAGYDAPDEELAIFHFKTGCTTDELVVSQLQWQQPSTRSFVYENVCYAKTALMKVDAYVYDASLNVGVMDVRSFSSRGPLKTILSPTPYLSDRMNLYIGKIISNSNFEIRPEGYVRSYKVNASYADERNHAYKTIRLAPQYKSVFDSTVVTNYGELFDMPEVIETYSPYGGEHIWINVVTGKGCTEAFSYNGMCAIPPLPSVLPNCGNTFGASPIRIPITGEILKVRAYLGAYDELICQVRSCADASILYTFNLRDYHDLGWQWLTFDLSQYIEVGYLTFAMRPNSTSEPLLDVYYFEQKVPEVPEVPDVYDDLNALRELDVINDSAHTYTDHEVTFEYSDVTKTVTATGTATGGAALFYVSFDDLDPGVYYINANVTPSDTHRLLLWDITAGTQAKDTDGQSFRSLYADETNEFVIQSGHEYTMMFRVDEGKTVDGATFTPIIYALEETIRRKGVYKDIALDIHTSMITEEEEPDTPDEYTTRVLEELNVLSGTSSSGTDNGVTFAYDATTHTVTATGTATAAALYYVGFGTLDPGTYYINANVTPEGSNSTYRLLVWDITAGTQALDTTGAKFKSLVADEANEFVIEENHSYTLMFRVDSGVTVDGITFSPVIYAKKGNIVRKGAYNNAALDTYDWIPQIPYIPSKTTVLSKLNVFGSESAATDTINGITFVVTPGEIFTVTANGTCSSQEQAVRWLAIDNLPVGTYLAGINITGGGNDIYNAYIWDNTANARAKDSHNESFKTLYGNELNEFVVEENTTGRYVIGLRVSKNITVNNLVFKPVIFSIDGVADLI